jgi:hypothetical protein
MLIYLAIWLAASVVVLALTLYRRALLRDGMALACFGDPELDLARYQAAFRRRVKSIDRWVRAVAMGCPGSVFIHALLRFCWQAFHATSTWQVIRAAVAR